MRNTQLAYPTQGSYSIGPTNASFLSPLAKKDKDIMMRSTILGSMSLNPTQTTIYQTLRQSRAEKSKAGIAHAGMLRSVDVGEWKKSLKNFRLYQPSELNFSSRNGSIIGSIRYGESQHGRKQ